MCGTWFGQSGKGRSNARQYSTKKLPPLFVKNYYWDPQHEFGDKNEGRKNGFCHLLLERSDSISISWFWSDHKIQQAIFEAFDVSLSDHWKISLRLLLQTDCLYGVRWRKDNFWPRPWIIIYKSPWPPCIFA